MSKMRILFVDDEELVLAGLRRMLRPQSKEWDMEFVTSGAAALAALDASSFDLVVSDVRMPGMDGLQLLDTISEVHPDLIRIILSGHSDQVATLRSTTVAHQYLAKPCAADVIAETVARSTALRDELTDPQLLAAIAKTKTLPAAPSLYQRLTEELTSGDPSLGRVSSIVAQDPALTAKIIQIVNSAFFALRRRITDITEAVTLLGIDTIMALVLSTHLFNQEQMSQQQRTMVEAVWTSSLGVATTAKAVCAADGNAAAIAQEAFLAGMLHDAGKLVFAMNWPDRGLSTEMDLAAEREAFGADHALVGAYLLSMWGLPDEIVEAVAYHHEPSSGSFIAAPVLTAVHVAHSLESRASSDEKPTFDQTYLAQAGLEDRVESWLGVAEDLAYQRENA